MPITPLPVEPLFDQIQTNIETRPQTSSADKGDLKAEVKEIQVTITKAVQKNEEVDEGFLSQRFRNIPRMAPDVLDMIVATLANLLAGLGAIVKKVAQKVKEETK